MHWSCYNYEDVRKTIIYRLLRHYQIFPANKAQHIVFILFKHNQVRERKKERANLFH